jgi:hypothetical protein
MHSSKHLLREAAHLAFRAVPEPPSSLRGRLKYFGISEGCYAALRGAVLTATDRPLTARDLLGQELRATTGHDSSPTPVLSGIAQEDVLMRVGAAGPQVQRAVLRRHANLTRRRAARRGRGPLLARRRAPARLRPARFENFRWRTGVPKGHASAAIATVETLELEGGYFLLAEDREAFEAAENPARDGVDILPRWACYTMGHPRRPGALYVRAPRRAVEKGGRGTVWAGRGPPGRPGRVFFLLPALAGTASPAAPRGGDRIRR